MHTGLIGSAYVLPIASAAGFDDASASAPAELSCAASHSASEHVVRMLQILSKH